MKIFFQVLIRKNSLQRKYLKMTKCYFLNGIKNCDLFDNLFSQLYHFEFSNLHQLSSKKWLKVWVLKNSGICSINIFCTEVNTLLQINDVIRIFLAELIPVIVVKSFFM